MSAFMAAAELPNWEWRMTGNARFHFVAPMSLNLKYTRSLSHVRRKGWTSPVVGYSYIPLVFLSSI
jgi:hypothetical protein